jgi:predicted dehydrogenase
MQDPNVVNAILELESGVSGTAHLDYVQAPGQRSFRIIGDRGYLEIDALRQTVVVKRYTDEFEQVFRFDESFDQMMSRQLDHFFEVIDDRMAPNVSIDDGLNAIRVADAMIAACRLRTWREVLS